MNQEEFLKQQKKLGRTWRVSPVENKTETSKRLVHCEPNQRKVLHFEPQKKPFVQHFYPTC